MKVGSPLFGQGLLDSVRPISAPAAFSWLLGFGLVAWLGLGGGGFDPLLFERVGVYAWWIVLAGVGFGILPVRKLGTLAWSAIAFFALLVVWTAVSLAWTESPDKTMTELARISTYFGVFGLAVFARTNRSGQQMASAMASAIVVIAAIGLLSRLHPAWFPGAAETGKFLTSEANRLAFPINYWNGLGALIAMGLPVLLNTASTAKSSLARAVAAAGLPVLVLTLYFTLSRGSFLAALLALFLYLTLAPDRIPKVLTLVAGSLGGVVLIVAAEHRDELSNGLMNNVAREQGNELLLLAIGVILAVGALQFGVARTLTSRPRPRWSNPNRRQCQVLSIGVLVAALSAVLALGGPGKLAESWSDFKSAETVKGSAGRLESSSGNGRYQYWSSAIKQFETRPLSGTGAGTFEYWWGREGDRPGFIRDAHSLYFQTLGELGIVGFILLVGFLLLILVGGFGSVIQAPSRGSPHIAALLAGSVSFCVSSAFDWIWQIPVLPIAFMLLASVLVGDQNHQPNNARPSYGWQARLAIGVGSMLSIAAISVPLYSTSLINMSQTEVRAGRLQEAFDAANRADAVQPWAASPNLQKALVLEQAGDPVNALREARMASLDEPTNWRIWLVRSRLEAAVGQVDESVKHFRKMQNLRP